MRSKTTPDDKRSHLEFIQGVINRLSSNTFLFKGWSVTIIGAVFTAMITTRNNDLLWLILGIVLIFWAIDAYYLMLERGYRKLYKQVAETSSEKVDYGMNIGQFIKFSTWLEAFRRPVLLLFYGIVLIVVVGIIINNNFDISLLIKIRN
ncbi:hypothetical protein LRM41_01930 [Candidatus Nanosynbacter sp. TM7-087]|jgi:hypothetical protein|uniref:hypothetical protein n=1 Tax=Candidatus Nanosynbacter sp. TM7-087 TaxID=2902631 RepID=UPI001FB7258E|nr:hypothetical protein [Candidatus Nanosynbacter sp. TM7-087]MCJ1966327.1 hypothetical protein [Candidatus Nanosynbacter sp. TM7-087]